MQDIQTRIAQLRRPRLLIQAARFGLDDYLRGPTLCRLLRVPTPPKPAAAVVQLLDAEAICNAARKEKATTYSVAAHIELLIAIMAEAQAHRATRRPT